MSLDVCERGNSLLERVKDGGGSAGGMEMEGEWSEEQRSVAGGELFRIR